MSDVPVWRPLMEHIALLADAMGEDPPVGRAGAAKRPRRGSVGTRTDEDPASPGQEWARSLAWLRMASGLREVRVQPLDESHPSNWMCGPAAEYAANRNEAVSLITTEYTRHLYVWNSVERYLKYLALPGKQGPWTLATKFLKDAGLARRLPPGYRDLVRILHHYAHEHGDRIADGTVRKAFEPSHWQDESGTLLMVSHKLRHPMAHGSAGFVTAVELGLGDWDENGLDVLQGIKAATRGLLISLQMLLLADDTVDYCGISESPPWDGWPLWNPKDGWFEAEGPLPAQLFWSLHLKMPDAIDADEATRSPRRDLHEKKAGPAVFQQDPPSVTMP